MQSTDGIRISEDSTDAIGEIERALTESLQSALPQAKNSSLVLTARDPEDRLVGGLTAVTSYGWMLIKMLWVKDKCRNNGVGRRLMRQAEEKARDAGCHGVWLDTSNPQAMAFYRRLGYEIFGQLENGADQHPASHCRWFLRRAL